MARKAFGPMLREQRERLGLNTHELAAAIGQGYPELRVTGAMIRGWEEGGKPPSGAVLEAVIDSVTARDMAAPLKTIIQQSMRKAAEWSFPEFEERWDALGEKFKAFFNASSNPGLIRYFVYELHERKGRLNLDVLPIHDLERLVLKRLTPEEGAALRPLYDEWKALHEVFKEMGKPSVFELAERRAQGGLREAFAEHHRAVEALKADWQAFAEERGNPDILTRLLNQIQGEGELNVGAPRYKQGIDAIGAELQSRGDIAALESFEALVERGEALRQQRKALTGQGFAAQK